MVNVSKDQINEWLEILGSVSLDYPEDHSINTVIDELDQMSK
ncbi:hypothetical protein [uncultured Methanolobus sp.]|nr:hypothetical protein [uncultured Methanolobus sp.]